MKSSLNLTRIGILKCIILLFLLNPTNTVDAKIDGYTIEEMPTQDIKLNKRSSFKKNKLKRERKKWYELSYGEKSFRMSIWVLVSILFSLLTAGFGVIVLIFCAVLSIRLGLRSLKEKEEGISRKKRNQGILISLITLVLAIAIISLISVIFITL